ncbi:MAG: Rubrerythrin [Actinobacteria bacterium]|nr:Rubrerythrin [Actinomycetota bacterium]
MPEFADPFSGMIPRKMTKEELIRAIRLDLTAEEEAIHLYMAHADATDDPLAKKVLIDVANEERVHAGEFQRLLSILASDEDKFLEDGAREVDVMQAELSGAGGPQEELSTQEEVLQEPVEEMEITAGENNTGPSKNIIGARTIGSLID